LLGFKRKQTSKNRLHEKSFAKKKSTFLKNDEQKSYRQNEKKKVKNLQLSV